MNIHPNLIEQFERATPILFTGAGFSLGAKNILGNAVPSVGQLKSDLWEICFPGEKVDEQATLQHLFEVAVVKHKTTLTELLNSSFTVDADSVPGWYAHLFDLPWHKVYTLNIDNLDLAVQRKHAVWRKIVAVSAANPAGQNRESSDQILTSIHLNGTLEDVPDKVTFSNSQYAERLTHNDPVYVELSAELISHPFVFIGTKLDEPSLWQHVELRFLKGGNVREFRRRSYLVSPSLDLPRRAVLSNYNVEWISMTAEEFANALLPLVADVTLKGKYAISKKFSSQRKQVGLPEVAELAKAPVAKTEFLLGEEPVWGDILSGRAVTRKSDFAILQEAKKYTATANHLLVISGTAGSGKSTALQRVALKFSSEGKRVAWIDRHTECTLKDIREAFREQDPPPVIAIDDADMFGPELSSVLRELLKEKCPSLVIIALRSTQVDRILNPTILKNLSKTEIVMPLLEDDDIEALVDTLERENRLGVLFGKPRRHQIDSFRKQAGRELLVGMIQATSGKRFEDKASDEFEELSDVSKKIYALVCVAYTFRLALGKKDILIGMQGASNEVLNCLHDLIHRRIIIAVGVDNNAFRPRHRVIADIVFQHLQSERQLYQTLHGLALVVATQATPQMSRNAKPKRLLIRILSHDFLHRALGRDQASLFYGELENLLSWDFHYWLQRGSFELEFGNLRLAELFLSQARGLAPDDLFVQNEYGYLLFRKALDNVSAVNSSELVEEATELLSVNIAKRGTTDPHPYHIYGSQGLAWSRRGIQKFEEKKVYLEGLLHVVEEGEQKHPNNQELKNLLENIRTEYLNLALKG